MDIGKLVEQLYFMHLEVEFQQFDRTGQLIKAAQLIGQFEAEAGAPLWLSTLMTVYDREPPHCSSAEVRSRNRQFVEDAHTTYREIKQLGDLEVAASDATAIRSAI